MCTLMDGENGQTIVPSRANFGGSRCATDHGVRTKSPLYVLDDASYPAQAPLSQFMSLYRNRQFYLTTGIWYEAIL